jgi:hypothetical protein
MSDSQARCVLHSDARQACKATVVFTGAAWLLSKASNAVFKCKTRGSDRLALIAVIGCTIIPIPFLLQYLDLQAWQSQAIAFKEEPLAGLQHKNSWHINAQ